MLKIIWRRPLIWAASFLFAPSFLPAQENALALESKRANAFMAQGQYAEAIPLYKHLIQAVPGNPGLILDLGLALHMSGHPQEAIPQFEAVLNLQPKNVPALSSLASCRLQVNQPARAIAPLEQLLVIDSTKRDTRGMLAGALMALERFREAASQYQKLTALDPQDARAWFGLGSAYEGLASSSFARLEKVAPESAYVLQLIADSQASRAQYRSAFYFYHQAQTKSANLRGIHLGLAAVYRQTGHNDWAQQETTKETSLPQTDCARHIRECNVLAGKFMDATRTAALTPEDLFWSIKAYNQLALEAFGKLGHLPESAEIHGLKASLFRQHRQYKESASEWKAALQLDPGNKDLQREWEAALFQAQDYESLRPLLERDIAAEPDSGEANFRLGQCLLQLQQADKAIPYLTKAARQAPGMEAVHASLGLALMQVGRQQEAVPELEKALKLDDTGSLHYQLSRAYQSAGQAGKSRAALAQYQQIQARNQKQDETLAKEAEITPPASR